MDLFANIGKAVLIQSLGLQKNYTETASESINVIDHDNNTCHNCKYCDIINSFDTDSDTYKAAQVICESCPHKVLTTKTVYKKIYHNEKNRYGYKPRLNCCYCSISIIQINLVLFVMSIHYNWLKN